MTIKTETMNHLQTAIKHVVTADNRRLKAADDTLAKTEEIIVAAIEIGSLAAWDEYRKEIDRLCRVNKRTAKALGYVTEEVERKGTKTLVTKPRQTLANIFSVIRQSFALSVPLTDGRGEPRAFNAIKAEKSKKATKAKAAKMTDTDKDIAAVADMFDTCIRRLKAMKDPADVHALRERIKAEVLPLFPAASKAA